MSLPAGAGNRLVTGAFAGTWNDLEPVDLPAAAAVFCATHLDAVRTLSSVVRDGTGEVLIAAANRFEPELVQSLSDAGLAIVRLFGDEHTVQPAATPREPVPGRVWLLTSGSTGRPKQVAHTLESLTTVGGEQPRRTWLCPYTPGAYAWWQVVTLGLGTPGQDIVFIEPDRLGDWADLAVEHGVTAISGTPTFWRQSLMQSGQTLADLRLEQATLGGEPVDQRVLDQVQDAFPEARVSWIYASSEAGASIAVHDGIAGFPVEWLDRHVPGRPGLSVVADELVLESPKRGEGISARLRTGDRVETRDGRVLIVGRLASDEINVGGAKVSAAHVREVLLNHPLVTWAAVKGRRAPLVGTVVAADVVAEPGVTETELARYAAAHLADHAVPRRFRLLDSIPLKESLKSDV
ncbi:MAG: AMP-binding protein [Dermatophilaceae bacterium]|nr:AMP-binding protein [Intrasporangiaceae bacterium]